jgi:DNA-directed DNA polymerase III PolC
LNAHSCYSMMRGIPWPAQLCAAAKEMGLPAVALTDTNGLYGLVDYLEEAKRHGIPAIIGAEVVDPGTKTRAVLLVKKRGAYKSLCEIISKRHMDPGFELPRALEGADEGLAIVTDDRGILNKFTGRKDLYCEIRQTRDSHELSRWAGRRGIPDLITANAHFLRTEDRRIHRLLRAIDTNTTLKSIPDNEVVNATCWYKSSDDLIREYPHLPGAARRAGQLAAQCETNWHFGNVIIPKFPTKSGVSSFELLKEKCEQGLSRRYSRETPAIRKRLEKELDIIKAKNFSDIFLIVADVVRQTTLTCGRGSAAASIVSYLLFITHVDPIAHNLYFERFLSKQRVDPPDIDVDFAWDERDAVLDYIFKKYGPMKTAMVSNHVTMRARASIRELAKVYGLPDGEIARITTRMRKIWFVSRVPVSELIKTHPQFKGLELPEPWPEIIDTARMLEGRPRYLSVHCGGVVIVPGRISGTAPVQRTPKGVPVLQWEKDQTEDSGLVKIDILGNRSLAVIRDALAAIKQYHGVDIPYAKFNPLHDPETQDLIAKGDTIGVFYVESPATRQLQKKTGKGDFEHLVIHSSIIRPAANRFINEYIRRLHGGKWEPLHPLLEDILSETYGIMSYQEDVSKTAIALAGFSVADSDYLRKIISKKSPKRLQEYKEMFFRGALERKVELETIEKIWEMIQSFSGYSFCKPHSASYAMVSFKSAWLRAHFPAEFMAAVITNQGGFYSAFAYLSECRRMGLKVLMPDVNLSARAFKGRKSKVRVGLMQVKGLSDAGIEAICETRKERPYESLNDFLSRTEIDPADARLLVKAGCFDSVANGMSRPDMMWRVYEWAASRSPRKTLSLFGDTLTKPAGAVKPTEEYNAKTMLKHEVQTLGFLCSRHPLELYKHRLKGVARVEGKDLHKHAGRRVTTLGWYVTAKIVSTKNNEPMEFVCFEDTTAIYETVFFPKTYARFCHMITHLRPYLLRGTVDEQYGVVSLNVDEVRFV